jgi:F-type H+-transporting ATPase subunit b
MGELISKLGIDFKILIAQIINFFILLFVLYRFAYKPVLKALENRSKRIEQSLKDAKAIEEKLQQGEADYQAKITEAEKKAGEIMVLARTEGDELRNKMLTEAKTEIQALVTKTKAEVADLKEQVITEARSELADLVVAASGRVISEKLTDAKDLELVKRALSETKQ